MKELTFLMILILVVFFYINFLRKKLYLEKVKANNGIEYLVRNLPDKVEAANKLGSISDSLKSLVNNLDENDDKKSEYIKNLKESFNPEYITENIPGSIYVAYSVNKGEELSLCIREKDTEAFIDNNTIIFVAIHELAHIMTPETGHTPLFWDNMKFLLEQASSQGIYMHVDYSQSPVEYCGMDINSTPMKG
tara:strand:+ start:168 stop:743 length:576 start_codon:yes stop_codon:yes gene_type:complete